MRREASVAAVRRSRLVDREVRRVNQAMGKGSGGFHVRQETAARSGQGSNPDAGVGHRVPCGHALTLTPSTDSEQALFQRAPAPPRAVVGYAALRAVGLALAVFLALATQVVSAAPDERVERDLIARTNLDRTSNGLGALLPEARLTGLARERSEDMLARDYFSHQIPPTGERVFAEMDRRGFAYEVAGENLGWNTAPRDSTVQFVQRDFMNSPSHRENVLRDAFTEIGVGSVPSPGKFMHTVLFLRPTEGGARPSASAPAAALPPATVEQPTPPAEPLEAPADE